MTDTHCQCSTARHTKILTVSIFIVTKSKVSRTVTQLFANCPSFRKIEKKTRIVWTHEDFAILLWKYDPSFYLLVNIRWNNNPDELVAPGIATFMAGGKKQLDYPSLLFTLVEVLSTGYGKFWKTLAATLTFSASVLSNDKHLSSSKIREHERFNLAGGQVCLESLVSAKFRVISPTRHARTN